MKLITTEIEAALLAASSNGERAPHETPVIVKYFVPWGAGTWWVTEGEQIEGGDWRLFGFAELGDPQCAELGYVLLSELESVNGPAGLKIERDLYFPRTMLSDVLAQYGKHF